MFFWVWETWVVRNEHKSGFCCFCLCFVFLFEFSQPLSFILYWMYWNPLKYAISILCNYQISHETRSERYRKCCAGLRIFNGTCQCSFQHDSWINASVWKQRFLFCFKGLYYFDADSKIGQHCASLFPSIFMLKIISKYILIKTKPYYFAALQALEFPLGNASRVIYKCLCTNCTPF